MNIKKATKGHQSPITYFVFALLLSIIFVSIVYIVNYSSREEKIVEKFQNKLLAQLAEFENKADQVQSLIITGEKNQWLNLERIVNQDDTYALVFFRDSLLFWNNNQISQASLKEVTQQDQILYTSNGWYLLHKETFKEYKIYLLKLIKSEYSFENLILPEKISEDFSNCQNLKFTFDKGAANYLIYDQENLFLIGLDFEDYSPLNSNQILILFLLFIGIYYFLIVCISAIYNKYVKFQSKGIAILVLFIIDVILLRFLDYYFQFPGVLKDSFLFERNMGSLIGFSSVGDLVLNSLLIVFIAAQIYSYAKVTKFNPVCKPVIIRLIFAHVILFIFVCGLFSLIRHAIIGLPYHSFFGVNFDSITGVLTGLSIALLALSVLIFGRASGKYFLLLKVPAGYHFLAVTAMAVCCYYFFDFQNQIIIISAVFIFFLLTIIFFVRDTQHINFIKYLVFIVLLSGTTAAVVNSARNFKKNSHQILLSNKLSNSVDRSLENVYDEFQNQINKDTTFNNLVYSSIDEESILSNYLSRQYFGEYSKYNIQLTVCEDGENLEIQPEGLIVDCSDYFENLISINGEPTNSANLYLVRGDPKSIYYIGKLTVTDPSDPGALINMYVEFYFTFIPEGLGYPELLVDNTLFEVDLSGYSYARYSENQLLNSFGNFPYQTNYDFLEEYPNNAIFIFNANKHYKQKLSPGEYLIISQPVERMSVQLVTFSSLFIIIAIILFIAFLIIYGKEARKVFQMSFQTRLQIIFISTISFIIILLAIITLYYVEIGNEQKLAEQLTEKTNSVIIELEHKLSGEADLVNYNSLELEQLLRKFSLVFFSDINVYSPSGKLLATSRPEIFEKGLISDFVNPMAYEELFAKNKLYYLTQESIGDVTYHSSYAPLILGGGQTAGIVNLPYFARQSEVIRSYYLMIFTFINAFVLLGIVGAFIAIALSKVIAKPLVVLQKSLAGIQIDKQNEPIEWDSDDEIGQLIAEYNRLIDKLEQSTALLKQSERESTWREVAQQIAHEIKNPLTPMKLNVQYLEKAFNQGDPNLDEKVKSISSSLVSQIDTLNKVAEMFSDFATSNVQNFQKVDLLKVISEAIQLFKNNPGVTFKFDSDRKDDQYIIHAHEKDLLRLFNNLIKNAVQSIDGNNEGFIQISLNAKEGSYVVRITDNGKGIPNGVKASIFQPYFTTKSGGTGLGLAIVKNIMTEIGGEIGFESLTGEGTTFILKFKAA